jgi:hypothetical protein
MRLTRLASLATIAGVVILSACSSNSPSRATAGSTSSATGTASTSRATGPRIVSLTGPPTPVQCNAPTQVELHWETSGANRVELRINSGAVFATYADGPHDELVPLACEGTPQTYQFTARAADGQTATRTLTLTERAL